MVTEFAKEMIKNADSCGAQDIYVIPRQDNYELYMRCLLYTSQNPIVAYMTWEGYNFEDAVIMSERLVKDDVLQQKGLFHP